MVEDAFADRKLPTTEKLLALTFDDGPDSVLPRQVLDLLERYRIQAAFFCIGAVAADHPLVLQRMAPASSRIVDRCAAIRGGADGKCHCADHGCAANLLPSSVWGA